MSGRIMSIKKKRKESNKRKDNLVKNIMFIESKCAFIYFIKRGILLMGAVPQSAKLDSICI